MAVMKYILYHDPMSNMVRFSINNTYRQEHFEKHNKLTLGGVKKYLGFNELVPIIVKPRNMLFLGSLSIGAMLSLRNAINSDKEMQKYPLSELPLYYPEYFI